jgi:Predicted membrane protein
LKPKTLWEEVEERSERKGLLSACLELYRSWASGGLELEDPSPPATLAEYLLRPDYSLWLWTVAALVLATFALVAATEGAGGPLLPLRYVLGTVFVLFLPGYALVEALYPRGDELSPLERLALSIGLSLALVPLVGLLLNYTPFGIRLYPVLASLSLLTLCLTFIGAWRKLAYAKLAAGGRSVSQG